MFIRSGEWVIILKIRTKLRKYKSLHLSLIFLIMVFGMLPLVICKEILLASYEDTQIRQRLSEMQSLSLGYMNQILSSGYLDVPDKNSDIAGRLEQAAEMYDGRIQLIDAQYRVVLDTRSVDEGKYNISEAVMKSFKGQRYSFYNSEKKYIEFTMPLAGSQNSHVAGVMIVGASVNNIEVVMLSVRHKANILLWLCAAVMMTVAFLISWVMMRPFKRVRVSVEKAREGESDIVIENAGYVELRGITDSFQAVLGRLRALDTSRQEFVSNVSHELKTPITSMRVLADSLLTQENVPAEIYREFMADISEEIDRESKIISDLLALVKLDKAATEMNLDQVNINELVEGILKRLRPIAEKRNIELVLESFRPITAEVDEVKLSLAITNLVENAIKYNKDDGWVHVSLNADHKYFFVKVADSGVGIPEDAAQHIFERFYRVDKARSRETGGTGLGLAITQNVINLHHGAIKMYSRAGEGSTFMMRIPLSYIA